MIKSDKQAFYANSKGFAPIWVVALFVGLVPIVLLGVWLTAKNTTTQLQIKTLKSQINQIEANYKSTGELKEKDQASLLEIRQAVTDIQSKTASLSIDAKKDIANLSNIISSLRGTVGQQGQAGEAGQAGSPGTKGEPGNPGEAGAAGSQGPQGAQGEAGPQGVQGPTGLQGATGIQGATGAQGLQGDIGAQGIQGAQGVQGVTGATGPQGIQGAQGLPGSNDCISGVCVSRQSTIGTPETGNINITGTILATTLQGDGAGINNVNATTLQGNNSSYFTNATNLISGTVSDARLSNNVALLDADQTFAGSVQLTAANTALTVTNSASLGSLTVVNNAGIGGNLNVTGGVTATNYTKSCGSGYVPVPGNPKFGTSDFCVMKYEAKNDGSGGAISAAAGNPYVSVSQQNSQDKALAAGGHLMSEAEWMTIANNALWQPANWCELDGTLCGNTPGTSGKYLASGHQDSSPNSSLAATTDDNSPCYGTVAANVNAVCGEAGTQKRTLTLSNGSIIWDFPGNVEEWTDSWILGTDQPSASPTGTNYREFTAFTKWQALSYSIPTNRGWGSAQRIGQVYSNANTIISSTYSLARGGYWGSGLGAGAFALDLNMSPTDVRIFAGFRVAK